MAENDDTHGEASNRLIVESDLVHHRDTDDPFDGLSFTIWQFYDSRITEGLRGSPCPFSIRPCLNKFILLPSKP